MYAAASHNTRQGIADRRQPHVVRLADDRAQISMQRAEAEWAQIATTVAKTLADRDATIDRAAARQAVRETRIANWYSDAHAKPTMPDEEADRLRAINILHAIADRHGVRVADIKGPRRFKSLMVARHHAIAEVHRQCPSMSISRIGRMFRRDHTTILHAVETWQAKALKYGIGWMDEMEAAE